MAVQSKMPALELVSTKRKSLEDYRRIVGDDLVDEIRALGQDLQGLRLLHLNATASGGGVAELLNSLVPLEADCGLDVEWRILCPDEEFFQVTKGFHNALQGKQVHLSESDQEIYLRRNQECAAMLKGHPYDAVIIHDPQPAAMAHFGRDRRVPWLWRCHIDSSEPCMDVWEFLRPYVQEYNGAVFTMKEFVPPKLNGPTLHFIQPAIDPLSPKNRHLPKYLCREEVAEFGIDLSRPLMIQVSRFDPWKDPWGVIEAYRMVKEEVPTVQLALIGAMSDDDPQGWDIYHSIQDEAQGDRDLFLFTNVAGVGAHEVNAFQRTADVVVQKSIREGFGLVVSEAVWKGTPVVAGNTGGIPLQVQNGVGGFLVNTPQECAEKVTYLLSHSDESERIARRGWENVRDEFLMPRLLLDELKLLRSLVG